MSIWSLFEIYFLFIIYYHYLFWLSRFFFYQWHTLEYLDLECLIHISKKKPSLIYSMNYSPSFRCQCIRLYYFTQFKYWESKLRKLTAKELLADWDDFPYPGRTQNLYSSRRMFTILRWLCPWLISFCLSTKFKAGSSLSGLPLYLTLLNIFYNFFFF